MSGNGELFEEVNEMKRMFSPTVQLVLVVALAVLTAFVIGGDPWGP